LAIEKLTDFAPADAHINVAALSDGVVGLGPIIPMDFGPLFLWLNDAEAAKLDLAYRPLDCVQFKSFMDQFAKDSSQVIFAIRRVRNPQIFGFTFLRKIEPVYRSAELGIRVGAEADRGKGLGKRALVLILSYAWNTLNLHRVSLTVIAHNVRAIAAYKAVGFAEEGMMRDAAFIDGKWCDVAMMAALNPARTRVH
jgi:RimJ/RimL family protein N-acetyltransferase